MKIFIEEEAQEVTFAFELNKQPCRTVSVSPDSATLAIKNDQTAKAIIRN